MTDAFSGHSFPQTNDQIHSDQQMTLVLHHWALLGHPHFLSDMTTSRSFRAFGRTQENQHCVAGVVLLDSDDGVSPLVMCLLVCRILISMALTIAALLIILFLHSLKRHKSLVDLLSVLDCEG